MKSQSRDVYLNLDMAGRAKKPQRLGNQTTLRTQDKQRFRAQHSSERTARVHFKRVEEENEF